MIFDIETGEIVLELDNHKKIYDADGILKQD